MVFIGVPVAAPAASPPSLRTQFDVRVNAIPASALRSQSPAALVDPARQRAARTITDLRHGLFFAWAGGQIWALAWLWRSGRAARLRDFLRRAIKRRWAYRAAFGAALGLLTPIAGLPFAFITYRIGFNVGLSEEVIGNWLLDYARAMFVDALGAAAAVALVLELVERMRLWYVAYLVVLVTVAIEISAVAPIVFEPLTTRFTPLPIAAEAPVEMSNASARTRTLTASTEGIGSFTRIVLGDVLLAVATPSELAYVIAHEDAHVRHADDLKLALVAVGLFVVAVALAVLISDRVGFRRDDDAVSRLALVGAFLGAMVLLAFPVFNAYARGIEYRADEDARHGLSEPTGAVRLLVRHADHDLIQLCNRRSTSWYFADRPALGSRIAEMRGTQDPCPH